MLYLLISLN